MGMAAVMELQENRSFKWDSDGKLLLMLIMQKQASGDATGFGRLGRYLGQPGRWVPVNEVLEQCSLGLADIKNAAEQPPSEEEAPERFGGFMDLPDDVEPGDIENEMKHVIEQLQPFQSDKVRFAISM